MGYTLKNKNLKSQRIQNVNKIYHSFGLIRLNDADASLTTMIILLKYSNYPLTFISFSNFDTKIANFRIVSNFGVAKERTNNIKFKDVSEVYIANK